MGPHINIKARIERHSRILQHNFSKNKGKSGKIGLTIISIIALFLLPFYPVLSGLVHAGNEYEFYRGFIDESSIIDSYFDETFMIGDGSTFIESRDSYLHINSSFQEGQSQIQASKDIIEHEVLGGESLGSIATKYSISVDTLRWENNLTTDTLRPGQKLRILPTSGLSHKVNSGETLSGLAKKYNVSQENIMRQNSLLSATDLKIGDIIIIPGGEKEAPKAPPVIAQKPQARPVQRAANTGTEYNFSQQANSEIVNTQGRYPLVWRQPYSGIWGNCTWYVASYKNVNWRGNANQWMKNAREKGHQTGSNPTLGAIVQFEGRGYNPRYGHVGIVIDFDATHIIVSDMNYRRLGEVTTRKVPRNDRTIQGYIYVD